MDGVDYGDDGDSEDTSSLEAALKRIGNGPTRELNLVDVGVVDGRHVKLKGQREDSVDCAGLLAHSHQLPPTIFSVKGRVFQVGTKNRSNSRPIGGWAFYFWAQA